MQHGDAVLQGALDGAAGGHAAAAVLRLPLAFKGFAAMLLAAGHSFILSCRTNAPDTFFVYATSPSLWLESSL